MGKFQENFRLLRKQKKVRQKDVAEYLGVAVRTIQSYEYGDREPSIETLIKLADYFDVTLDYLMGRRDA